MKDLYKMTKEELIALSKRLQSENERLQSELDNLSDSYTEMENELAKQVNSLDEVDIIKSVDLFKFRLEVYGLLTADLEDFITKYMKFYNVAKE